MKFLVTIVSILFFQSLAAKDLKKEITSFKVYDQLIAPVFEARCQNCHGENKDKGKLRMHTRELLLKGGRGAGQDIIIKGDPASSELVYRITLPKDDEEAMPPYEEDESYRPVTVSELKVIKEWIKLGASFDVLVSDLEKSTQEIAEQVLNNLPKKIKSETELAKLVLPEVQKASSAALESVAKTGVLIMPIAQNTNALYINASYLGKDFDDKMLEKLLPVADQVLWLNLARTRISDFSGKNLERFRLLTRLHLENTKVSDGISPHLSKLNSLEYLNLYGTKVSDASIPHLTNLKNLKKVFAWQTKITPIGAENLKRSYVDNTSYQEMKHQHKKLTASVRKLTLDQERVISSIETKMHTIGLQTIDKVAVNSNCPVSQKKVSAEQIIVFEGRKVAFCCGDCSLKFSKDPGSYRSKIGNFEPSIAFREVAESLLNARSNKDLKIENESIKLRDISYQLRSVGPEVNLGWTESE